MGLVNIADLQDGVDAASAASINQRIAAILSQVNGNLDGTNLVDSAVSTAKLANGSVTPNKLATGAASNYTLTSETRTLTTFASLATVQSVTVTVGSNGVVLVHIGCACYNTTGGTYAIMGFAASGANTIAATDDKAVYNAQTTDAPFGRSFMLTGLNPGSTTFTAQFRATGGTATFARRELSVLPL